ncbi:T9SS type A sorting domain-containing protein [bacterium SCSIO 12741]|nr:T9SS type A sorting domain-containing protein [bacterium SCSIO 12741]
MMSAIGAKSQCPTSDLRSYLQSDQKDNYLCSSPITLELNVQVPDSATSVTYQCNWNGNGPTNSTTYTVSSAPLTVNVTGHVTYTIEHQGNTVTCSSIPFHDASLTVLDGSNSVGAFTPVHYWTFEPTGSVIIDGQGHDIPSSGSCLTKCNANNATLHDYQSDLMTINDCGSGPECYNAAFNLRNSTGQNDPFLVTNGVVGQCAIMDQKLATASPPDALDGTKVTQEYLIKFHPDFQRGTWTNNVLSNGGYGSCLRFSIVAQEIQFGVYFERNGYSNWLSETKTVTLSGVDRKGWEYYLDDEWHHIAVTADLTTGTVKLYIDGICPEGFTHQYYPDPSDEISIGANHIFGQSTVPGAEDFGWIDEFAYHTEVLPPTLIYKHYTEAINQGLHYSFLNTINYCSSGASISPNTTGSINILEYPEGYSGSGTGASNIDIPIHQFENSPFPRYLPGNTLLRNFPWFEIKYLAGSEPSYGSVPYEDMAADLAAELALNWNYYTMITNNSQSSNQAYTKLKSFANSHPEIPACMFVFWAQLDGSNIGNPSMSPNYYLRDSSGNITNRWSPLAPLEILVADGDKMAKKIVPALNGLQRPLDIINENGELTPDKNTWWDINTLHGFNPNVLTDFANSGLDWNHYMGRQKTAYRNSFRDGLLGGSPLLTNTRFTHYSVNGLGGHSFSNKKCWNEIKKVQKNIPGDNYYATPSFDPLRPAYWNQIQGDRHGTEWIRQCRLYELPEGDDLFSPFVCAGRRENPTTNIRPGQWLGLLKGMAVLGSEFYYTSYFSAVDKDSEGNYIFQDPRHWAWQILMPSYAQAITSRYEHILRNGELLMQPTVDKFNLKGGGTQVYNIVKKWTNPNQSNDIQYVITTSHQRYYNTISPQEKAITLSNLGIQIMTRPQGSTYIFKKDEINYTEPVMIQLDGWHESIHPTRWSKDFVFEAEVPDYVEQIHTTTADKEFMMVRTRFFDPITGEEKVPQANTVDYTDFVTYYTFPNFYPVQNPTLLPFSDWSLNGNSPKLTYQFRVSNGPSDYRLYVRARIKENLNGDTTGIHINLTNEDRSIQLHSDYLGCINDDEWTWYSFGLCNEVDFDQLNNGYYLLDLIPENEKVEIDKIILDYNKDISTLPQNELAGSCGSATPNITPYALDKDFTWIKNCVGEVEFTSSIWPLLNPTCGNNLEYEWNFSDASGTIAQTQKSNGILNQPPYLTGTYENPIFKFNTPGTYTVTMTVYKNGVPTALPKTIQINPNPAVIVNASNSTICAGESVHLSSTVTGGNAPYTYSWYPSITLSDPEAANTDAYPSEINGTANTLNPFQQNQYKLTVTDANGCTSEGEIAPISIAPPLCVDITTNSSLPLCYGTDGLAPNLIELTADVCVSNCTDCSSPTGPITYDWKPSSQLSTTSGQIVNISNPNGLISNSYTVVAKDQSGCVGEKTIDVLIKSSDIEVKANGIDPSYTISKCQGDKSVIFLGTATASGGGGTYTYEWSAQPLGATPTTLNIPVTNPYATAGDGNELQSTLYTITAKDQNGCIGEGYVLLDVYDKIQASLTPEELFICPPTSNPQQLMASHSGTITGSPTYFWTLGTNSYSTSVPTTSFVPPGANYSGTYSVKIEDGDDCYSEAFCDIVVTNTCKTGSEGMNLNSVEQQPSSSGKIILYPNPNSGSFQLEFSGGFEQESWNVVVFNLQGKVISQKMNVSSKTMTFNLNEIPRGVYFIRVFNSTHHFRMKTVID